ncbi:biliverdin-producing heme oxygenase [Cryobacterium roopkundense]|uniref:Heme oxygenase n=1 Tax=Cryobacterium roopkundense TaxID=1001240 RepID=A0A7W8ZVD5_9MICO|nr:biliverdin-producing heme oxygenase [Cryobacterium roopkundense]MBB5640738.1 heme oxygenase [Cryobacterium roopkundense]
MLSSSSSVRVSVRRADLPARLRDETSDLHHAVELRMGLPESVRSRGDYSRLLARLFAVHSAIETRLDAPSWSEEWRAIGLELVDHQRASLLRDDLHNLGVSQIPPPALAPELTTFGQALGCLYVVEGSAVGGRVLAPAIQTILGRVPTAFLDGETRGHPHPWQATLTALRRFEDGHGDGDDVILGARITFRMFGHNVARSTWTTAA